MKSRPILFSAPMIRALLDGRKTQTRRVVTTREPLQFIGGRGEESDPDRWGWFFDGPDHHGYMVLGRGHDERRDHGITSIPCPYGELGDQLWVRETWSHDAPDLATCRAAHEDDAVGGAGYGPYYRATEVAPDTLRWHPSIFMPRWASRITLEVTEVRVQRLQAINEEDARAEGVASGLIPADEYGPVRVGYVLGKDDGKCILHPDERRAFEVGWDSINGKRAPWSSDPWVWCLTFRRLP